MQRIHDREDRAQTFIGVDVDCCETLPAKLNESARCYDRTVECFMRLRSVGAVEERTTNEAMSGSVNDNGVPVRVVPADHVTECDPVREERQTTDLERRLVVGTCPKLLEPAGSHAVVLKVNLNDEIGPLTPDRFSVCGVLDLRSDLVVTH